MSETATAIPLADWQADMERRGKLDCKFRCPFCGNEATPNDFKAAGAEPERAARECVGRVTGAKGSLHGSKQQPCDWAAFGLFGTLNEGTKIQLEDGREIWVFDFAGEAA